MAYVKSEEVKAAQEKIKQRLLTEALVILAQSGMKDVTMRNIAQRAEIHLSSIYRLYPGRDEILAALSNRKLMEDLNAIEKATRIRVSPRMQLAAALAAFYEQMKRPRLTRALFELPQYRTGVLGIFRRLIDQEGIPADDPELAAVLVVSVLYGAACLAKRQEPELIAMAALRAMGLPGAAAENAVINARYATARLGE